MKQITIRIDDEQYSKLKNIEETFKIRGVGCLIRRSIDLYLTTFPHCDRYMKIIDEERRKRNEYN